VRKRGTYVVASYTAARAARRASAALLRARADLCAVFFDTLRGERLRAVVSRERHAAPRRLLMRRSRRREVMTHAFARDKASPHVARRAVCRC